MSELLDVDDAVEVEDPVEESVFVVEPLVVLDIVLEDDTEGVTDGDFVLEAVGDTEGEAAKETE
jgi:hypothetical protein